MSDQEASPPPEKHRRSWRHRLVLWSLVVMVLVVLIWQLSRPCSPCMTHFAEVADLPDDIVFVCIVADTANGIRVMQHPPDPFWANNKHPDAYFNLEYPPTRKYYRP